MDKKSLHNLQQYQRPRASKIDTLPEEGGKGGYCTNFPAFPSSVLEIEKARRFRNRRWERPNPCR